MENKKKAQEDQDIVAPEKDLDIPSKSSAKSKPSKTAQELFEIRKQMMRKRSTQTKQPEVDVNPMHSQVDNLTERTGKRSTNGQVVEIKITNPNSTRHA